MPARPAVRLLVHATRPQLVRRGQPFKVRTGYATLTPAARPSLRLAIHPSIFLFHVGSISLASCLIPVIGARRGAATRAEATADEAAAEAEDEAAGRQRTAADPPFPFIYPVQQPFPPLHQRRRLAAQLRQQLETNPLDAAFNLRQLRLVNEEPEIHLPSPDDPPSPYTVLSNLRPVPWVWRFPATVALHSILRLLRDPAAPAATDPRIREHLLPLAVAIAQHSLRFDSLMWNATLRGQQQQGALEWERLVADERRRTSNRPEAKEKVQVRTRLPKRPRERGGDPKLEVWEAKHREVAEAAWSGRRNQRPPLSVPQNQASDPLAPLSIRPAVSVPTSSLDKLFLYLVEVEKETPAAGPAALELADSISRLRRRRSRRALHRSFQLALDAQRVDLAAEFWVDYLDEVRQSRDRPGRRWLDRLLYRLMSSLRARERAFEAAPKKEILAAVATLTRALDELVSRDVPTSLAPLAAYLVRTLATFPPAPFAGDLEAGSSLRRQARTHRRVFDMIKDVLRRLLEDLVRRDIHLGSVKSRLGAPRAPDRDSLPVLQGFGAADFNTLISYSLLKLQSPELAMLVLERMGERGLRPTSATQNIVFSAMGGGADLDTLERLLQRPDDPYAVPIFLRHLADTASFDHLDAIVFRLLPELHYDLDEMAPGDPLPPVRAPDVSGRTPFLYTTLLYALSCAGRIGLAERVFRNGRWAAEISRSPGANGTPRTGWVLPPHAFTIMLQMYAKEIRRGRQLEGRQARDHAAGAGEAATRATDEATSTPFVRGWGRHALRVFLLQEQRSQLQAQLGHSNLPTAVDGLAATEFGAPSSTEPNAPRRRRVLDLPPFLRSEAAPIAATWELEGGSKEPELKSLERAMKSPQAADALRVLFPQSHSTAAAWHREAATPQERLTDLRRKGWRKGYRAGQDVLKERIRRRSEALQRHAVVEQLDLERDPSSS